MNIKKLVSAVSALAVAGSVFTGLAVTSYAATADATLLHTSSQIAGSTKRQWNYTLDQDELPTAIDTNLGHSNAGYAFIQMQLPTLTDVAIQEAKLVIPVKFGSNSGNRGLNFFSVSGYTVQENAQPGTWTYGSYETVPMSDFNEASVTIGDQIGSILYSKGTAPTNDFANAEVDLTEAVKAVYNDAGNQDKKFTVAVVAVNLSPTITRSGISLSVTYEPPVETKHQEAFTFEKTANELGADAMVKVVFQNDGTKVTGGDHSEALGTTFTGQGEAKIAVVVTGIKDGYSVKSVTIE